MRTSHREMSRSFDYGSLWHPSFSFRFLLLATASVLLVDVAETAAQEKTLICSKTPTKWVDSPSSIDSRFTNEPLSNWGAQHTDELCLPSEAEGRESTPLPMLSTNWRFDRSQPKYVYRCANCPNCELRVPENVALFVVMPSGAGRKPSIRIGNNSAVYFVESNPLIPPESMADCLISVDGDSDALRSFSKTSVLFVSISFIILMVISLAWLVFYYVQRFRYAHAKDRLQRRLFNAAKKALARIPTRQLRSGDRELDTDCPVCIDPYAVGDVVRTLPCRHVFHKTCIDPWLLEHRTCPMCKSDILKAFGYQVTVCGSGSERGTGNIEAGTTRTGRGASRGNSGGRRRGTTEESERRASNDVDSTTSSSDSIAYPFPVGEVADMHDYTPVASPQLVINNTQARSFAIIPLTVHSAKTPPAPTTQANITPVVSTSTQADVIISPEPISSQSDASTSTADESVDAAAAKRRASKGSIAGKIVNLVQVQASSPEGRSATFRGASASTSRAADRDQVTPVESTTDIA